jgi:hypothetical protein
MAFTEVSGARDKNEFFAGLRVGMGRVHGESGGCRKLTRDLFLITAGLMREKAWTVLLSPLATLLPAAALLNYWGEHSFNRHWAARILDQPDRANSLSGMAMSLPAMEEAV